MALTDAQLNTLAFVALTGWMPKGTHHTTASALFDFKEINAATDWRLYDVKPDAPDWSGSRLGRAYAALKAAGYRYGSVDYKRRKSFTMHHPDGAIVGVNRDGTAFCDDLLGTEHSPDWWAVIWRDGVPSTWPQGSAA